MLSQRWRAGGRAARRALWGGGLCLLLWLCVPGIARADDCAQDWRRAEDCLRSPGFAQGIATGAGTIITILVNGATVAQSFGPSREGEEGDEEPPRYTLDIRTDGMRTTLLADGEETLWLYAQVRCDKPEVDTASLTAGLRFVAVGPNSDWLLLGPSQPSGGFKAVPVRARPPSPTAQLLDPTATVAVSGLIEGELAQGPVELTLEEGDLGLDIRYEGLWR